MPRSVVVDTAHSAHARLRPVSVDAVRLRDAFWEPRRRVNREQTLAAQYRQCEETGRLDNFRRAAGRHDGPFQGLYFNDSDVYKWLEAVAWELACAPDASLAAMADAAIADVESAQQPDGYLDTYFMFDREPERWTNLKDLHELYCAGHLFQAAVAHHRATGSDRLLNVARRLADHICARFGTPEEGKQPGTPGHPEIEMALVELARETGEDRYLRQAQYFLDARGRGLIGGGAYHQDHRPFREQDRMTGHAVRHVYLCCGAADVYAETGEPALRAALDRLWDNMTQAQLYVSGGIGSRYEGEAFGRDYELPNERAYTETCAAIGSAMWCWRMLLTTADARYADLMEHQLYNAVLPGLSLDGQSYFYQNPLADDGMHRRQPWFGCACCPPNVARLLASLPGYVYSVSDRGVWVHLYAEGEAELTLPDGRTVRVEQRTRYPRDGDVELRVEGEGAFSVFVRVPAWCAEGAELTACGERAGSAPTPGAYAEVRRRWQPGDTLRLRLPMPVRAIEAHPYAAENAGRAALMRGPLLYCFEAVDNPGVDLRQVAIAADAAWTPEPLADLGGALALRGEGRARPLDAGWSGRLYRTRRSAAPAPATTVPLTAVPYYAWANRAPGRMQVWVRDAG